MRNRHIKNSLLTMSMSALALVATVSTINQPNVQAQEATGYGTYVVRPGEGLFRIAVNHGMTLAELKAINQLSSEVLYPGQILRVAGGHQVISEPVEETSISAPITSTTNYIVQPGDYLNKISRQFGVSVDQIKSLNGIYSNVIYPGQSLKIVAGTVDNDSQPTEPVAPITTSKTYTVQAGDTLNKISRQFGVSVDQIKSWNSIYSDIIYPGQVLALKQSTESSQPSRPEESAPSDHTSSASYTVRSGDYLNKIAAMYGMTTQQLKAWNNLSSNLIYPGQILKVLQPTNVTQPTKPTKPEKPGRPEKPTKPLPPTSGDQSNTSSYTVKSGDYLNKIASLHGISTSQLKALNNLTSNLIYPGQVLIVSQSTSQPSQPDSGKISTATYTVKTGDTLYAISNRFGLNVSQLKQLNSLASNNIYPGQVLKVSGPSTSQPVPVNSRSVFIDAGHGGSDTGAVSGGYYEKDLNLNISRQVAEGLRQKGYTVYETRQNDRFVGLTNRDDLPNELNTDIFVSIHHNAMPIQSKGSARGILTLYHDRSVDEPGFTTPAHHTDEKLANSKRLAQAIQNGLIDSAQTISQGTRPQNLHVTRTTNMPSALVELGFMDNHYDLNNLTNSAYQAKLVQGLINGIGNYFGH